MFFAATSSTSSIHSSDILNLTNHWVGISALVVFVLAYIAVVFEEQQRMRKSKPVLLAAAII